MQAHEMETKLRNAIKNQNTKILKIEDFNKAGINGVEFHNIKIVSNKILELDFGSSNLMTLIQNLVNHINDNMHYLIISVDVEAHHRRQSEMHVDRTIYGKFNNHQVGIREMMDIADELNIDITFFLDVLEEYRYKGEISKVAIEIADRGFDLQLHAHPEIIPNDEWENIMPKKWRQDIWSYDEAKRMFSLMINFFEKNNLKKPVAFRGGAYRYSINTLKVLKEFDFKVVSNYNAFLSKLDNQPKPWGLQGAFFWENGLLELPISYIPKTCENKVSAKDRLDYNFYEKCNNPWERIRNTQKCLNIIPINTMILHSWAFLYEEEILKDAPKYYVFKDYNRLEAFKKFLYSKPDDFAIISISELIKLINKGIIKIKQVENFTKIINQNDKQNSLMNISNNINSISKVDENYWFSKDTKNISFLEKNKNNLSIKVDLRKKETASYIESNLIEAEKDIIQLKLYANYNYILLSCYIVEYNSLKQKISTKSYKIKKYTNIITKSLNSNTQYIKILFRLANNYYDTIQLNDISILYLKDEKINFDFIKQLPQLHDSKNIYLLSSYEGFNSIKFKPRQDLKEYSINLPLNWDIDPYNDNNWKFQLNALRLLDSEISKYINTKNLAILQRIIEVILDWKRDIVNSKRNLDFDREEFSDSYAWHDMATGLRALKIAFVFEELVKLDNELSQKYIYVFYELTLLHIKALSKQKTSSGNHAIFQLHGLMMLLRLFPNDFENIVSLKQEVQQKMFDKFYQQFFKEGIHTENSDMYHYLGVDAFNKILKKDIYPNMEEVFSTLDKAKENCAYMHFPNLETITKGDTDFKTVQKRDYEKITEGITWFKESGYTYVYDAKDEESMFFLETAFLNRGHRHSDFFNILLYEYSMNILVDAGKYSYMKDNPFRKYCISTRAHNTVLINNEDYKLDRKYFFESKLVLQDNIDGCYHLATSHQYDYLKTKHTRHIFYKPKEYLFVIDILNSENYQNYKQIFHLHQDLEILSSNNILETDINENIKMYINMNSFDIDKQFKHQNIHFDKGAEGEIEGYRALGHNEAIENYVIYNEINGHNIILASMFSFKEILAYDIKIQDKYIIAKFANNSIKL